MSALAGACVLCSGAGAGENGRLGHGAATDRFLPTEVEELRGRVALVYAGSVHT
jgi:Regulator of chromosome condensation (RCC1) repeat